MRNMRKKYLKIGVYGSIGIVLTVLFYGIFSWDGFSFLRTGKNEVRVVIFHVNDVHGEIVNFAKIASVINQERKKCSNVFFVSAGDNFSGNPYVDKHIPKGEPILKLLNKVGCDIQVLGNHEFDYGQQVLADYMSRAGFKIICANIKVKNGIIPQPEPFAVLKTAEGLRIAFLGLLQISRATRIPDSNPEHFEGIVFTDEIETALKYRYLGQDNDMFVALTHLGYYKDEKLARNLGELDLIIGGHSHSVIEEPGEINGVLIVQTGSRNKYLGRIELLFVSGQLTGKKAELIDLKQIESETPEVKQMIEEFMRNPELNRVIARLPEPLQGKQEMGNLITDAIRHTLNLDVAFYNSGGIRLNRLFKTVRMKDIYAIEPFDNEIVLFEMTPEEIRSLIRFDYEHIEPLDLQVSGLEYTVIVSMEKKLLAVELKTTGNNELDEDKTYTVGMNNYMASAYRFDHRDPGKSSYIKVTDVLISFLKKNMGINQISGDTRRYQKFIN
ncbi:MAG: bifunctional metallophosphatase/5'-nucleotidase [Candidatus Aminicenantes bacterium]|nr:bifunctional metallophosphatase/5'-nucleotidase [Candidatus Aminicenantes bacterium]